MDSNSASKVLAQLKKRGLLEKISQAVGHLVTRADKACLDRAFELALAKAVLPALVVLSLLRNFGVASLFNSCRAGHEQDSGAAVELGANGVKQMAQKDAKERAL
eukprot:526989-Pleurochrysis_carterae.AAC.1